MHIGTDEDAKFSEQFGKCSVCMAKECVTFSRAWFSGTADEFEAEHMELEGVVKPMITNVHRSAGGGGDMLGDMSGGGFDDAPGAGGNVHDVVVMSASRTGERSSQVQGTSLLATLCCPRSLGAPVVSAEARSSRTEASKTRERRKTRRGERVKG